MESDALPLELLACKPFPPSPKQARQNLSREGVLFGLAVAGVFAAKPTILAELKLVRRGPLVFRRRIVALLAFLAGKGHNNSHLKTP